MYLYVDRKRRSSVGLWSTVDGDDVVMVLVYGRVTRLAAVGVSSEGRARSNTSPRAIRSLFHPDSGFRSSVCWASIKVMWSGVVLMPEVWLNNKDKCALVGALIGLCAEPLSGSSA